MRSVAVPEENYQCAVCLESFLERDPRMLTCSHTFCRSCLEECGKRMFHGLSFSCPICRSKTPWPQNGAVGFQKNFYFDNCQSIRQMLVSRGMTDSSTSTSAGSNALTMDVGEALGATASKVGNTMMCTASTQTSRKVIYESLSFTNIGYFTTNNDILQLFAGKSRIVTLEYLEKDDTTCIVEYDYDGNVVGRLFSLKDSSCISLDKTGSILVIGCRKGFVKVMKRVSAGWKLIFTFSFAKMLEPCLSKLIESVAVDGDFVYVIPQSKIEGEKMCIRLSMEEDPTEKFIDMPPGQDFSSLLVCDNEIICSTGRSIVHVTDHSFKITRKVRTSDRTYRKISPSSICFMNTEILVAEENFIHIYTGQMEFLTTMDMGIDPEYITYCSRLRALIATIGRRIYIYLHD